MTREEAIKHGKEQLNVFGGEHEEFIKVAVEALEQEPSGDLISKQAVLKIIDGWYENNRDTDMVSVKQEPKTGHWMDKKCSVCGCWSMMLGMCVENFCPNCGAKMVEPQESEDEE